ncbi:MAG: hypothetical protein NVSMB27_44940 [Ktedonobacteraceae bacterium]
MIVPSIPSLMREQSHPEVYFVYGGARFWIPNPNELSALGFDWSKVQVVPDGTLATVPVKPLYTTSSVKPSDIFWAWCVNPLAGIVLPSYEPLMSKDPTSIIRKDILVAGWLALDLNLALNCWKHPDTDQGTPYVAEDFHYDVILDADFMMQMYGNGGLSNALNGVSLPGNLSRSEGDPTTWPTLRFDDVDPQTGSSRGVTMNSFALPHMGGGDPLPQDYLLTGPVYAHGELNCFHVNDGPLGQRWYKGWGRPAPAGWVQHALCSEPNADAWWPYDPFNPDGGPQALQKGDYVLMKGTLWQEHAHDAGTPSLWRENPALLGHVGLIEMHPIDFIVRVQPPALPRTAYMVACNYQYPFRVPNPITDRLFDVTILPFLEQAPSSSAKLMTLELIDGRYSDMSTVVIEDTPRIKTTGNQVAVHVHLRPVNVNTHYANFKAVYLLWWQGPLAVSVSPTLAAVGTRVSVNAHAEDSVSHVPVAGRVKLDGQDVGATDSDISFVFERLDVTGTLSAPGFADVRLPITLVPGTLTIDVNLFVPNKPVQVTVSAKNAAGENVNGGTVSIANQPAGQTNVPFTYTFHPRYVGKKPDGYWVYPTGTVSAAGYQTFTINFNDYGAGGGP